MADQATLWSVELVGHTYFYSGRRYVTDYASGKAWEAVDRQRERGGYLSAFRLKDPESGRLVVVVVSEDEPPIRKAARLIAKGGEPWKPDHDTIERLVLRRAQVTIQGAERPGQDVLQRARYGKSGAVLDGRGGIRIKPRGFG